MPPTAFNTPSDYEPVLPARGAGRGVGADPEQLGPPAEAFDFRDSSAGRRVAAAADAKVARRAAARRTRGRGAGGGVVAAAAQAIKRGHALTYACLFLFSFVLFYRPYEFVPLPTTLAFWLATAALVIFLPSQLGAEGNLTARPREVNLVLLFALMGLLSVAFAKESRAEAWATFSDIFIRALLIFVVIVNAARTELRLRALVLLSVGSAVLMSAGALGDYLSGRLTVEGYRVGGQVGGIFGNPNDMALHLVTMMPLALGLGLGSRGILKKALCALAVLLMMAGTFVTFSRGGFLAMAAGLFVLAWTLRRGRRFAVVAGALVLFVGFFVVAPTEYTSRIFSIFDRRLDAYGSADARQALLMRSVQVAARNPVFGVGMGNFALVSFRGQVSHNAYTQVAAEMGLAALALYGLFLWTPLRGLGRIARETFAARGRSRFYYLAAGMQASLAAYMVASFFGSVAYYWNVYYLVGFAVCLRRLYEASPEGALAAAAAAENESKADERGAGEGAGGADAPGARAVSL